MKINVEIDCTPAEARQFFGLPDLQPMQDRILADMEERLRAAANSLSPETVMQQWFSSIPVGTDQMRQWWTRFMKPT